MEKKKKTMYSIQGGCHCGNISYVADMADEPSKYTPRACSCELCTSHGASYVSDNNGSLEIAIQNGNEVSRYRQGSRLAEFLICKKCGVLIGVCYEENGVIYGSLNIRTANEYEDFGEGQLAHLTEQTDDERIRRWKDIWFANVSIRCEGT